MAVEHLALRGFGFAPVGFLVTQGLGGFEAGDDTRDRRHRRNVRKLRKGRRLKWAEMKLEASLPRKKRKVRETPPKPKRTRKSTRKPPGHF